MRKIFRTLLIIPCTLLGAGLVGCSSIDRAGNAVYGAVHGIITIVSQFGQAIANIIKSVPHP
jgi:hypothetical protein